MTVHNLRAAAAAFLLGTASIGAAALLTAAPAQAANVRPQVGKPLQDAQALAAAGKYRDAMAKINAAEAVPNKTADETSIIAQMKQYIGVKSGDVSIGGAAAAKAKFANDYNAHNYAAVIADGDMLRKYGGLDGTSMLVIAQAYYKSGNKPGCVRYIKSNFGNGANDTALQLLMRCAYDAGDDETQRQALETLVAHTGKPEYWASLLKLSEHAQGMRDQDTLDIYRLKLLTGTLTEKDDYTTLAQIALQLGFPAESVAVIQKAQAANLLKDDRTARLLKLAQTQAGADAANQAKALAAANAAHNGDALLKISQDEWGQGNFKDAIDTAKAGIAKGPTDKNDAQIRLGMAYLGAGQKADALKAFDSVKGPDGDKKVIVAHLWSLYARH